MVHNFKQGDKALFVYEEDMLKGTVQETHDQEVIIQFEGISHLSHVEAAQLQFVRQDYAYAV